MYVPGTSLANTFAISFAILHAFVAFSSVTAISINSVSLTELTVISFFNSSSPISIPKFDITSLIILLLLINSLYVGTSFEFNVISVVVIVPVDCVEFDDVVNISVVFDVYLGVTNPIVYIIPINMNITTISAIRSFLFQKKIINSFKYNY